MLADSIAWALPELRAEAESLMDSTCTIRERSTETTTDPDTGAVIDIPGATVYSGRCRFRPAGGQQAVESGGAEVFTFDYVVSIPFAEADVAEGHVVTCDSSPDPALVDVEVTVEKVDRGDHITARRLFCSEVT